MALRSRRNVCLGRSLDVRESGATGHVGRRLVGRQQRCKYVPSARKRATTLARACAKGILCKMDVRLSLGNGKKWRRRPAASAVAVARAVKAARLQGSRRQRQPGGSSSRSGALRSGAGPLRWDNSKYCNSFISHRFQMDSLTFGKDIFFPHLCRGLPKVPHLL